MTLLAVGAVGFIAIKYVLPAIKMPLETKNYVAKLNIDLAGVSMSGKNINLKIKIANPNPTPMHLSAVVGRIITNYGRPDAIELGSIAHYAHGKNEIIAPGANTIVPITVALKTTGSILYFLQTLANKANQIITYDGTVTLAVGNNSLMPVHVVESAKIV